jgi:hypothetical protein
VSSNILDYRDGLEVSDDHSFNELVTLRTLEVGLHELAVSVWRQEEPLRQEDEAEDRRRFFFGNAPEINPHMRDLLPSFFHWYGVTLCNFARLVGFVGTVERGQISKDLLQNYDETSRSIIKSACGAYVKRVVEIGDVVRWRNKVAAHFAITDPRSDDSPMTLEASTVYPVSHDAGRFRVGSWVFGQTYQDGTVHESEIPTWSLTEVHEKLAARYWPTFQYPSLPTS